MTAEPTIAMTREEALELGHKLSHGVAAFGTAPDTFLFEEKHLLALVRAVEVRTLRKAAEICAERPASSWAIYCTDALDTEAFRIEKEQGNG